MKFLQRHLENFTEARRARGDWRLLFLDAFKPHFDQLVVDVAWSKGYVVVYHGGGTTGVTQVNDTDCHGCLEKEYMEVEAHTLMHQQMLDPGDISRSRQQAH